MKSFCRILMFFIAAVLIVCSFSACQDQGTPLNQAFVNMVREKYCIIDVRYLAKLNHSNRSEPVVPAAYQWYTEREVVYIPYGETADGFMSKMEKETELTDADGNSLSGNRKIPTGALITSVWYGDYIVVVLGDVNGDGEITLDDAAMAARVAKGEEKARSFVNVLAADVDLSFSVTEEDAAAIETAVNSGTPGSDWYDNLHSIIQETHSFNIEFCSGYTS